MRRAPVQRFVLTSILTFSCLGGVERIAGQPTYRLPPQEVVDIIDAPPVPRVSLSPDRNWMLLIERNAMPEIKDVARRMLRLAGIRIDPVAHSEFMTDFDRGIALRPLRGGEPIGVPMPPDARICSIRWSHRSDMFAFSTVTDVGQHLWVVSVSDPRHPRLLTDRLTTVMGGYDWMPDGQSILCQTIPADRGPEPVVSQVPTGPNVQESIGNASPTRTFQDLLSSPSDEALFEHYATAQLTWLSVDGSSRVAGTPAIYANVQISPSGKYLLVTTIQKPFSYLLTYSGFPQNIEARSLTGDFVHTVAEVPMEENVPIEGVRTGPRRVTWKEGEPATLLWMEALDGGNPNVPAEHRDRFLRLVEPFDQPPVELLRTEHRGMGFSTMADPNQMAVTEYDRDRRWIRTQLHDLTQPSGAPRVLVDRSVRDRYNDPGSLVMVVDETGNLRALQEGDWVFRIGAGASPHGELPFVDRQNLKTLETERLWRCREGLLEQPVAILPGGDGGKPVIIVSRESSVTPPNYFLHDLQTGDFRALTDFADPTPQIRGIRKQLVKYARSDGVDLSATLYVPADYQEGQRLPLIVWAYPLEFNDPQTAGQVTGSPHQFVRMRGITHLTLLTQGYAIMDAATMPIVGDPETMNDTFIEQIVASAAAAIETAVELGVADRNRVGVGGHSYGAFMTANLLAHCDLFRAGIARSGAYNRTLTPFGFQSERRDLWKAKEVYFTISPFMHADKINEPLLLIHGEADDNSGTFPMQSQRMYQAIKGNGGTVRLVMLPCESHGYHARESVLHTQAEMIDWLDKFVKNAAVPDAPAHASDRRDSGLVPASDRP
jgi:dipeptidyl aminopeptidase/acylaminoacyl peptidase